MISRFHNWRRRRKVTTALVIAGVFLLSATFAVVFNHQGNSGEQVAEAASRVNRQVDDTQEAFKEIKDLIPEEQRLEAAAPDGYDHQSTSGSLLPQPQLPAAADNPPDDGEEPLPVADDGYPEGHSHGIDLRYSPAPAADPSTTKRCVIGRFRRQENLANADLQRGRWPSPGRRGSGPAPVSHVTDRR